MEATLNERIPLIVICNGNGNKVSGFTFLFQAQNPWGNGNSKGKLLEGATVACAQWHVLLIL